MKKLLISALLVFFIFLSCDNNPTNVEYNYHLVTMDEIFQNKITNYVDSLINLQTKVYWYSGRRIIDPLEHLSDSIFVNRLKLKFENADNFITDEKYKNQFRGDLFVVSDHINTCWEGIVQKYCFKNDSLSNYNKTYIIQGRIQFRDWLNVTSDLMQDTAFINQSNNVVYWSQTFEFQVDNILDGL